MALNMNIHPPYNEDVTGELFYSMKRYVSFGETDEENVRALGQELQGDIPDVVNAFYDALTADEEAIAVLSEGPAQILRLQRTLQVWLQELFDGPYDLSYFEKRCNIGRMHVRVQLPAHLVVTAMSVIRFEISKRATLLKLDDLGGKLQSLDKLLDLELAIMLQQFVESFELRIRNAERGQMEQRLSEAEHMAQIGQLAASLAHEIKNPLAGISGAIQIIAQRLSPDEEGREVVSEILQQIDRLDSAVKDLLVYARPKPPSAQMTDLNAIVNGALKILSEEPSLRNIDIRCSGMNHPHEVYADPGQIQQVLCNLLLNGAHAAEPDGRIDLRLTKRLPWQELRISDNGSGISEGNLARVFEPFFTTKVKGTGLGLPICKKIIDAHGGKIKLQSFDGEGTIVTILLPSDGPSSDGGGRP